jgi:preprotein translocase subunit SecD
MTQQRLIILIGISLIAATGCSRLLKPRIPERQLVLEIVASPAERNTAMQQTVKTITTRLNALGDTAEVQPQSSPADGRIVVNVWRGSEIDRLKQIITASGKLELTHVVSDRSPAPCKTYATKEEAAESMDQSGTLPANRRVLSYADRGEVASAGSQYSTITKWVVVESPAIIDGPDLRTASAVRTGNQADYQIAFSLNKAGADKFGNWTTANINRYLGVILNDEVKSIAFIKSKISDQAEISGHFTKQSAEDLALVLKSGRLTYPVRIVKESAFQQK